MAEAKPKKDRSPSFPFISLGEAVKRLQAFEQTFGRHPAPAAKSGLAWGMKEGSSQAFQTLAALRAFGLLKYEGSAKDRHALLTDDARTYLRAQQESIKKEVVRSIALKPTQFQKFWSVWGADRPPDAVCLDNLILNHAFTDSAAHNFLKVYDETISFAGLGLPSTVGEERSGTHDEFSVGDFVNWEVSGQIQWDTPRKIIDVAQHDDGRFFYQVQGESEDEQGWIPIEQALAADFNASDSEKFAPPPLSDKKVHGGSSFSKQNGGGTQLERPTEELELNAISFESDGHGEIVIQARLNREGLDLLENKVKAFRLLLD